MKFRTLTSAAWLGCVYVAGLPVRWLRRQVRRLPDYVPTPSERAALERIAKAPGRPEDERQRIAEMLAATNDNAERVG